MRIKLFQKYIVNPFSEATEWVDEEFKRVSDYLWNLTDKVEADFEDVYEYIDAVQAGALWIAASGFDNSWVTHGARPLLYRKFGGTVEFRGSISTGTLGAVDAFTMPAEYRPASDRLFYAPVSGGAQNIATIQVRSDGGIQVLSSDSDTNAQSETYFDSIRYAI